MKIPSAKRVSTSRSRSSIRSLPRHLCTSSAPMAFSFCMRCCYRDLLVIYLFVLARARSNAVALPLAAAFLGVSVVPVYFVWLVPELFNFSLALGRYFCGRITNRPRRAPASPITSGQGSDYLAAALIGLATFLEAASSSRARADGAYGRCPEPVVDGLRTGVICAAVAAVLFAATLPSLGSSITRRRSKDLLSPYRISVCQHLRDVRQHRPVRGREIHVGDVLVIPFRDGVRA